MNETQLQPVRRGKLYKSVTIEGEPQPSAKMYKTLCSQRWQVFIRLGRTSYCSNEEEMMENLPENYCTLCKKTMLLKDNRKYGARLFMVTPISIIIFILVVPNLAANVLNTFLFTTLGIYLWFKKPRYFYWCAECQLKVDRPDAAVQEARDRK